mgnify:CR=1 FL=1
MSNYAYQVWDKITSAIVGTFDSHNEAKKEIEKLIREGDFWEEHYHEIVKVNRNKIK